MTDLAFFFNMFKPLIVAFFGFQRMATLLGIMYEDHRVDCCEEIPGPGKIIPVSSIPHLISTQLWLFFFSLAIIQFLNSLTDWHTICSTQLLLLLLLLVLIYHCGSCQNDNCFCCNVNKSAAYSPLSLSLSRCHSLSLWVSFFLYGCSLFVFLFIFY